MSVIRSVSLACDHPDCVDAEENASGLHGYETAGDIRRDALSRGWTRRNGKDYCPEHSDNREVSS